MNAMIELHHFTKIYVYFISIPYEEITAEECAEIHTETDSEYENNPLRVKIRIYKLNG